MKKILVPCDFSAPAQEAFRFAIKIAEQSKGEVHVLYILDTTFVGRTSDLSYSYVFTANFLKEMETKAEENFKLMWERYSPLTLPVKFRHRIGSLASDVEGYVRENEIDLVLMGTHGAGGASWGSNTEKVLRNSSVPVFAVRKAPVRPVKNIVLPLVPDQSYNKFSEAVKALQAFFGANIHLLWINTPSIFKTDSQAQASLQEFARDHKFTHYSINIRSDYTIEDGIYRFCKETDADMIAMGTHAWKGLVHFFTGSIAEDIVNHVNLPVWTYPMY